MRLMPRSVLVTTGKVLVYPKQDHVPATFTILNFPVEDVDKTIDELTRAGVRFEVYTEGPVKTDERGVFHGGGPKTMFERMDADEDGFLTRTELAAGHEKMMGKGGR